MKFNFFKAAFTMLLCSSLMVSCVSSKKYEELKASKEAQDAELADSKAKADVIG